MGDNIYAYLRVDEEYMFEKSRSSNRFILFDVERLFYGKEDTNCLGGFANAQKLGEYLAEQIIGLQNLPNSSAEDYDFWLFRLGELKSDLDLRKLKGEDLSKVLIYLNAPHFCANTKVASLSGIVSGEDDLMKISKSFQERFKRVNL